MNGSVGPEGSVWESVLEPRPYGCDVDERVVGVRSNRSQREPRNRSQNGREQELSSAEFPTPELLIDEEYSEKRYDEKE